MLLALLFFGFKNIIDVHKCGTMKLRKWKKKRLTRMKSGSSLDTAECLKSNEKRHSSAHLVSIYSTFFIASNWPRGSKHVYIHFNFNKISPNWFSVMSTFPIPLHWKPNFMKIAFLVWNVITWQKLRAQFQFSRIREMKTWRLLALERMKTN